jgi:ElaB/YqjD/DUF883 family membrane-anchored ribosome-binding protein
LPDNAAFRKDTIMGVKDETDLEPLLGEFKQLRADFAKLTTILEQTVRQAGAEAAQRARATGDYVWSETQSAADQVGQKIKEQPLAAAGTAFGIGLLFGLLFGSRR